MEIKIPTSWDDITLGQYIELRPILHTEQEDFTRMINILCVLTGKKREEIKELTIPDFHKLVKKMSFLNEPLSKELKKKRFHEKPSARKKRKQKEARKKRLKLLRMSQ